MLAAVKGGVGFGVFSVGGDAPRVGFRVGEGVLDLAAAGLGAVFDGRALNPFLALGRAAWEDTLAPGRRARRQRRRPRPARAARHRTCPSTSPTTSTSTRRSSTRRTSGGSSGPDAEPLLPNWRHLPVGYHGRAGRSSSAARPCVRPCGQVKAPRRTRHRVRAEPAARHRARARVRRRRRRAGSASPSRRPTFRDHVFGVVLVNDWSARDIQAWEYQPLGPFLGKSFATSIARVGDAARAPRGSLRSGRRLRIPSRSPYLRIAGRLGARRRARGRALGNRRLADERARALLDDAAAARARDRERCVDPDGRPLRVGDDLGAGAGERGLAHRAHVERRAARSRLGDGTTRTFLEDGDEVVLRGAGRRARARRGARDDPLRALLTPARRSRSRGRGFPGCAPRRARRRFVRARIWFCSTTLRTEPSARTTGCVSPSRSAKRDDGGCARLPHGRRRRLRRRGSADARTAYYNLERHDQGARDERRVPVGCCGTCLKARRDHRRPPGRRCGPLLARGAARTGRSGRSGRQLLASGGKPPAR